jgi:hypothetical protein
MDAFENVVPPMLYLPVSEHPDGGRHAIVRPLSDGRSGLLAYTALDRLARRCGANQPWMLVATSDLGAVRESTPFDVVAFDLDVPVTLTIDGRLR